MQGLHALLRRLKPLLSNLTSHPRNYAIFRPGIPHFAAISGLTACISSLLFTLLFTTFHRKKHFDIIVILE